MRLLRSRWVRRGLLAVAGAGVVLGAVVYVQVQRTPGGIEEWLGDTISEIRTAHPSLVKPTTVVENFVHEYGYRLRRWWTGGSRKAASAKPSPKSTPRPRAAGGSQPPPPPAAGPSAAKPDLGRSAGKPSVPSRGAPSSPEPEDAGAPVLWKPYADRALPWLDVAHVVANPEFPEQTVLALRIDLGEAKLHWQPGKRHPCRIGSDRKPLPDEEPLPDRSGRIPSRFLSQPVVAFGGGYESTGFRQCGAIHGGHVLVPLTKSWQTVAVYNDGSVLMAPWASPALPPEEIVEARQNLPPLIHQRRIAPNILWFNTGTRDVKYTLDDSGNRIYEDVHTWRSAMGIDGGGKLVYVFGPQLNPDLLARTLLRLGAVEGMQLDINAAYHCAPALFKPGADGQPVFVELCPGVVAGKRFLSGSSKDFFFFTPRGGAAEAE
jgi:hypothetical protein